MQPTPDFDAARLARSLLRRSRQGALATLMAGSGDPYCSLVNVASHADGSPILLISRLALHTRNILADSRVSLMLDERAEVADWHCTGCDPGGLDLQAGAKILRLDFPRRIVTPAALRKMLIELADQARAAASI